MHRRHLCLPHTHISAVPVLYCDGNLPPQYVDGLFHFLLTATHLDERGRPIAVPVLELMRPLASVQEAMRMMSREVERVVAPNVTKLR